MKKILKFFGSMALCAALVCPMSVSCTDIEPYDDTEIREQIDLIINKLYELEQKMNDELAALKALLDGKLLISDVSTDTQTGITTITLSDGKELQLLPKTDLASMVTYITSAGVDYWAYIDKDGKKQYFLDENGESIPVKAEIPEIITRDGENFLVIGGVEYPLSGNSVFSDYELVKDELTGEVYAVTFTFGEGMSFTVTVDGAAGFMFVKKEGWSQVAISEQFIPNGATAQVYYQAFGVVDYVLQIPDGWRVKETEDALNGKGFSITSPSAELVESGIAAGEGELKVVAVLQGGRAMVAKINLTSEPFKEFGVTFGKANIKMNNGLIKFVYGVCLSSSFDKAAVFAKALEVMDPNVFTYPAGYGYADMDIVDMPVSEIMQAELVPGNSYTLWALPALYDDANGEFYIQQNTFMTSEFNYSSVKMDVTQQSSRDANVSIEVDGAESYYFGVVPKDWFLADDIARWVNEPGYLTPKTELIYNGSAFELAGETAESGTEYVAWLVVAVEGKTYTAADVFTCEFKTQDLQPGSAVKVVADVVETSLDVAAHLTAEGAEMIYYAFLKDAEAKKYADDAARAAYLFENGWYMDASFGVDVNASSFDIKMKPEMKIVLMALATDSEGKYSEVLYQECTTRPLEYNDLNVAVNLALNTPEEVKLNVSVTGGETVDYLYWIGKTSANTWKSPNYLGGNAANAQKYMYLNANSNPEFAETAAKYPVVDGVISMTDLTPGTEYAIVIMAEDAAGLYSQATELKFTPLAKNIGTIVLESDPKWDAAKPTVEWIENMFVAAIGNGFGIYALNLTIPANFTAYVLLGSDYYFTNGEELDVYGPISVEDKILTVMDWADRARDSEKVIDEDIYEEKGYPYGHEFYHHQHGNPVFGNAVIWASKEYHDSQCDCVEKEVEKTAWNGEKYIQKHVLCFNDGRVWRFENHQATGNKDKVIDRVFVVLQDLDGNCYQPYEWDVPVELFNK